MTNHRDCANEPEANGTPSQQGAKVSLPSMTLSWEQDQPFCCPVCQHPADSTEDWCEHVLLFYSDGCDPVSKRLAGLNVRKFEKVMEYWDLEKAYDLIARATSAPVLCVKLTITTMACGPVRWSYLIVFDLSR